MTKKWLLIVLSVVFLGSSVLATHDPNLTCTIVVHGFDPDGADLEGVFGADQWDETWDSIAEMAGLPNIGQPDGIFQPNVIAATTYYGSTPPDYYTSQDLADIESITAEWGGGIPRYAAIVAKYAEFVMERSGAEQVNFLSGSMGSYVVRWLIEKDVENLASDVKIARWFSLAGVVSGNWAASNDLALDLNDLFGTPSIDIDQMNYAWCEENVHSPRTEADSPFYGNILVGMLGTVNLDDGYLTTILELEGEPQANDGVVTLADSYFHTITPQSQFLGKNPTMSQYYETHESMLDCQGIWYQSVNFLTGKKRVTVKIVSAQVNDINEPDDPWWDFTPAEIVFQSQAFSPIVAGMGIENPLSIRHREYINAPMRYFNEDGETQNFEQIIYDDFLTTDETVLEIELWAEEVDWDENYDLTETIGYGNPIDDMGGDWMTVSVEQSGNYTFSVADWNCNIEVEVFEYPFNLLQDYTGEFSINFATGWNWFSVNVENDDMSLDNVLYSLGENANLIKNQTGFATYYADFGWYGLDAIDVTSMYMIQMTTSADLVFAGTAVDFVNTPISLSTGWNWVGYLPQTPNNLDNALASIGENANLIKSQTEFATYYEGFGWYGGLEELSPGGGYMLKMINPAELIFGSP